MAHTTTLASAASVASHDVRVCSDAWTAATVTWVTRPAVSATRLGTITSAGLDAPVSVTLDAAAVAALGADSVSFAVTSAGTDNLWFWSSEQGTAALRPELSLTHQ